MRDPDNQLIVLLSGHRVGVVAMEPTGHLTMTYDEEWRQEKKNAMPVSLSMPLSQRVHTDPVVRAFLWGLLPDNDRVLETWARSYQVSAGNPFALLRHVGEDCAGAAQFIVPERVDGILHGEGGVQPLAAEEIAERIRILRRDPAQWHARNNGQFSLAGAQAKTALHRDPDTGQWGEPYGAVPTTHILKPAITGLDDHDLNEYLCLAVARILDLPAARAEIMSFASERVVVIERYDRLGSRIRIHQEDMCQALGVPPDRKYQSDGGPTPEQIIDLLRHHVLPATAAAVEVGRFVDALAFNWLIGGTDAHAKNYSLLLSGSRVRLAPLYDLASVLIYDDIYVPREKMAMKIGGEYRLSAIAGRHWRRLAVSTGLDPDEIIQRIDSLALRLPTACAAAADQPAVTELPGSTASRFVEALTKWADDCRLRLRQ